ncbi:hypothetical protein BKA93DRAFT_780423 [Sparassis latifolia]
MARSLLLVSKAIVFLLQRDASISPLALWLPKLLTGVSAGPSSYIRPSTKCKLSSTCKNELWYPKSPLMSTGPHSDKLVRGLHTLCCNGLPAQHI